MDARFRPEEIAPTADGARLAIRWADGELAEYAPWLLRTRCPCAGCVDEMTGIRTLHPDSVSKDIYPQAIHYVGRYALQFIWSDGHATGIYPFEYLRRLSDETQGPGQEDRS